MYEQSSTRPIDGERAGPMRTFNRLAVALVFFFLLSLPILWFGRASFAPAPLHENRVLSQFPDLSIRAFQQFERWFSDRFGMRDALVYYGSRLQMARTGAPTNQDVVVGPTKWLFYDQYYVPGQPHFADTIGKDPLSPSALKTIGANVQAVHEALKVCKIPFYFVIAPDKQSVYPEKLGIHIPTAAQSNADQLIEYLRTTDSGLNIIDLRNPLVTARAGAPFDLYKRTDTHWNSLGAFYGYQAIVRRLTADRILPASPRSDLADWDVTQAPFDNGDIAVNLLSLPGYFEDYNTHFEAKTARHAQWSGDERRRQSQNPEGLGNLVMYRDSFAGELLPFLAEDFESTVSFLSHEVDGDTVRNTKPSVVMLQIVGRNIRMLKEGPKNLGHICTP